MLNSILTRARNSAVVLFLVLTGLLFVTAYSCVGCAAPASAGAVSANQIAATSVVAKAYADEHVLLVKTTSTILAARRADLVSSIYVSFAKDGFITPEGADPAKFAKALGDPANQNALVLEVRDGRMTQTAAGAFLDDFAKSAALSDSAGYRRAAIEKLGPVVAYDSAARSLLAALDARRASVQRVYDSISADAAALAALSAPGSPDAAGAVVAASGGLVALIPDPAQRDAVAALLASFSAVAPGK